MKAKFILEKMVDTRNTFTEVKARLEAVEKAQADLSARQADLSARMAKVERDLGAKPEEKPQ